MFKTIIKVLTMLAGTGLGFNVKGLANMFGMSKKGIGESEGDRPLWAKRRIHAGFWAIVTVIVGLWQGVEFPEGEVNAVALASENVAIAGLSLYTLLLGAWGKMKKEKLVVLLVCGMMLASCVGLKNNVRTGCIAMEDALNMLHGPAKLACDIEAVPEEYCEDVARTYEEARMITEGICHIVSEDVNINVWGLP